MPRFRSDPQQSLAQVHVRTPSEARETFRGRAGSATGVAQTVRPQPGDATADSQSARLSHSPHRDVRGKRNPARRPSAGCLLCNPRVASFRLAAHGTRTRPQTPPLRGVDAGLPFARRQRRREGESRRVFRARRDWRRAGSPRGADAEAKARGLIHLAESCRRYPPSRQASFAKQNGYSGVPEKARSELLPAPQRRATGLPAFAQSGNPG